MRKRRKKNQFLDDEADGDGRISDEENSDEFDEDLDGFIDDSENNPEADFELHKKVEIELNKVALRKFLEAQDTSTLEEMGIGFIYSKPSDLVN